MSKDKYNNIEKGATKPRTEQNKEKDEKSTVPTNLKKNPVLSKKKCKHNSFGVHACTPFGIGIKGDNESRCDMPYIPSMKSLPCTSSSDTTLLLESNNKELSKSFQKYKKRNLRLSKNKDNIRDSTIEKNLLENVQNYKHTTYISSDSEDCSDATNPDLQNVNSIPNDHIQVRTSIKQSYSKKRIEIVKSSQTTIGCKETKSITFAGQKINNFESNKSLISSIHEFKINLEKVFDGPFIDKYVQCSETDVQYLQNENQFKTSMIPTACRAIKGKNYTKGRIKISKKHTNDYCRNLKAKTQPTLLFDCNKYPLTDSQGKILKTAGGKHLVKYKNGKPYDCFGRPVFDSRGNSSSYSNFKPFSRIQRKKNIISEFQLFDFRGYCLLNYDGSILKNADGKNLIQVDEAGKILYDINKHPIFDKNGIPVTKQKGLWLLPTGTPLRVFDKTKHPLTNKQGEPLHDIKGRELLKCDENGSPLLDCHNNPVFDALGNSETESKFNPSIKPTNSKILLIAMLEHKPAKLFDKRGWPLTEKNGEVMNDSSGCCLLMLKKVHPNQIKDFDQLVFRLNGPVPLTEISLYLPDTKLPTENRHNINNEDEIKEKRKIILDFVGHPLSDRFEDEVFDKNGRKIFLNIKAYFIEIINDPSASTICKSGEAFSSLNASHATIPKIKKDISEDIISFQTEADLFGRPLNDSSNRPLFDKYGRPFYDLFGRAIYDSKGLPIATADAKRLDNGLNELSGINLSFKVSCLTPQDPRNLPKFTDLNGGPLFDSLGYPLYNQKGKPLIDAYGRPLYDENGFPQCDQEGRPVSKLVKKRHMPILSVEDKVEILQLSPTDNQRNTPGAKETRQNFAKTHNNEDITDKVTMNFIARIRVTTFSNGEKYYEILESVPLP